MKKSYIKILFVPFIIGVVFIIPSITNAGDKCTFSGTLEIGTIGEEVKCLQRYLNSTGYVVSTSGAGSSGSETDSFQTKTKEAVKKWQIANGIYPATGNFGPLSKSVYEVLATNKYTITKASSTTTATPGTTTTVVPSTTGSVVTVPASVSNTSAPSNTSSQEKKVRDQMKKVREAILDAEDEIENAEDDGTDVTDMNELIEKAKDKLIEAVYAFIDTDYDEALTILTRAQKYSDDSIEDIVDDENMEDAEDAIADAKAALNSARDDISEADDDGDDVDDALDIYNDAKAKYDDAREAFDDEDYEDAIEMANDAEDMADEAVDAL